MIVMVWAWTLHGCQSKLNVEKGPGFITGRFHLWERVIGRRDRERKKEVERKRE